MQARILFLSGSGPGERTTYSGEVELGDHGVWVAGELYPWHLVRKLSPVAATKSKGLEQQRPIILPATDVDPPHRTSNPFYDIVPIQPDARPTPRKGKRR